MALIGNRSVLHKSPGRFLNAGVATFRSNFNKHGMMRNSVQSFGALAAVPYGHSSPSAWMMAKTAGAMSAFTGVDFAWTVPGLTLAGGVNIEGVSAITWSVPSAPLQLIADLAGTSTITWTVPNATLGGAAGMTGTSTITFTVPNAILGGSAGMTGTANITFASTANLTALAFMTGPAPDAGLTNDSIATAVDIKLKPRFDALTGLVAAGL